MIDFRAEFRLGSMLCEVAVVSSFQEFWRRISAHYHILHNCWKHCKILFCRIPRSFKKLQSAAIEVWICMLMVTHCKQFQGSSAWGSHCENWCMQILGVIAAEMQIMYGCLVTVVGSVRLLFWWVWFLSFHCYCTLHLLWLASPSVLNQCYD